MTVKPSGSQLFVSLAIAAAAVGVLALTVLERHRHHAT